MGKLYVQDANIKFNASTILYNNYKGRDKDMINMFILITKQYIYCIKCQKKEINFSQVLKSIYEMEAIENCIAEKTGKTISIY